MFEYWKDKPINEAFGECKREGIEGPKAEEGRDAICCVSFLAESSVVLVPGLNEPFSGDVLAIAAATEGGK